MFVMWRGNKTFIKNQSQVWGWIGLAFFLICSRKMWTYFSKIVFSVNQIFFCRLTESLVRSILLLSEFFEIIIHHSTLEFFSQIAKYQVLANKLFVVCLWFCFKKGSWLFTIPHCSHDNEKSPTWFYVYPSVPEKFTYQIIDLCSRFFVLCIRIKCIAIWRVFDVSLLEWLLTT